MQSARNTHLFAGTIWESSVSLEEVDAPESKLSLHSTVHGAGRVMGRKQAAGVFDRKTGVCKREGLVKPEMMEGWLNRANVLLRGGAWMNRPTATSACRRCSPLTATLSASCTRLRPWG